MAKNYTPLHTPLRLDILKKRLAEHEKNAKGASQQKGKTGLTGMDMVLIVIGIITTVVLGVLLYKLHLKDSGM
jgi:hypothetical protein